MERIRYSLHTTSEYGRDIRRIFRKDVKLARKILSCIKKIRVNPFDASLGTHRVLLPSLGRVFSSRVNGDIRIIWTLHDRNIILLLRIGGHSGSSKVYR